MNPSVIYPFWIMVFILPISMLQDYGVTIQRLCDISSWQERANEQGRSLPANPVDNLESIAKARIPIIHVVGDADSVVPVSKHTDVMKARLQELGSGMEVIHKPGVGHHPHSLEDPTPIVEFILESTGNLSAKLRFFCKFRY